MKYIKVHHTSRLRNLLLRINNLWKCFVDLKSKISNVFFFEGGVSRTCLLNLDEVH